MRKPTRRTFLTVSGAVLGGIATGTTVTAAESVDRWIIDTKSARGVERLDVIHDLDQVDLAVVRGTEDEVDNVANQYASDLFYQLEPPADGDLYKIYSEDDSDDDDGNGGNGNGKGNGKGKGKETTDDQGLETSSSSATNETFYSLQWDKQALDIPTVHERTRGEDTRVAIIDTGVAAGHPDLTVNESLSQNFTGDGLGAGNPAGGYHGTHVGGIVAANLNGKGVTGTAPATDLVDCRVFSPNALASFADILAAMIYSAEIDADVANLSLGAYPIPRQGLGGFYGKSLNRVMTWVNSQGTALAIAAGNDAADLQHDGNFISLPNEGARAISISATGPVGFGWDPTKVGDEEQPPESPAIYTNYGTNAIDIGAPGGDIAPSIIEEFEDDDDEPIPDVPWHLDLVFNTLAIPTYETDDDENITGIADVEYTYGWVAGTSMAAPQVAGAIAAYRSLHPDTPTGDVEASLEGAAEVPDGYGKEFYGGGFLNIVDAL